MTDTTSTRLTRLLACVDQDRGNLALRKDAIREACDTGQWGTARELIDAGLQADPREPGLLAYSGFACLQEQRYGDAEQAFADALAQGLNAAEVRYNQAFARFMQKRYATALVDLGEPPAALVLPTAALLRARCLYHLARPDEAMADCKTHLFVAPDDADAHGLLALLLHEQGQTDAATAHISAALRQNPTQLEALLALASTQSDARQYDAANVSFDILLKAHPQCGRGWLGLGLIKLSHRQTDAAERDIELAAAHMPDHVGTWHVLAWTQILRSDVSAAERSFERALALDRTFGETHGGLAVTAALQGREADAGACIKRALRLNPQSMAARYAQMLLLKRRGEGDAAQALLDAFLASPVPRGDMRYRDLVGMHMQYLGSRADGSAGAPVLH